MKTADAQVAIIGAGPAGLSLAYHLGSLGMRALVFEQGECAGWSWQNMPEAMMLNTPWRASSLPDSAAWSHGPMEILSRSDYAAYLRQYAAHHRLEVVCHCAVRELKPDPQGRGVLVHTANGPVRAEMAVSASGYFHNPRRPEIPGMARAEIPTWHTAEYRSAGHVKHALGLNRPRLLVVGGRISAGQTALDLHAAGCETWISPRTPLRFSRQGVLPAWLREVYFRAEDRLVEAWGWDRKGDTFSRMEGAPMRRLLKEGQIRLAPPLARVHGREVWFVDGERGWFDGIILATGYAPVLEHLGARADRAFRQGRMVVGKRIYCLGLDRLANFRSRFLRGIREDAEMLAQHMFAVNRIDG